MTTTKPTSAQIHCTSGRITVNSEYYNDVHRRWMPVPKHWIGTYAQDWTHQIHIPHQEGK
jgi:hypothetical protein